MALSATAVEEPADARPDPEEEPSEGGLSFRSVLRVMLTSGSGKLGITLFLAMVALSIYVIISYPLQFGRERWSNPVIWADNPKAAPPVWTTWLGGDGVEHQTFTLTEPTEVTARGPAEVRSFQTSFTVEGELPTFLSMTLLGVRFSERPPVLVATLVRPDGAEIRMTSIAVRAARAGEEAPYERYYDAPERVLLTEQDTAATSLQQAYQQLYPDLAIPSGLSRSIPVAVFSKPASDGSGGYETVTGEYTLDVQVLVANTADEVEGVEVVIGGTVFGVMGTDAIGRDLWEGLLYGFPVGLLIATLAAVLSTVIGASLGILSGYAGGLTDTVIQRLVDVISNVPVLPLLIFLVFILGSHLYLIILVLVAFSWTGLTILVRSMVLQVRSGQLVEAARALGASRRRIMARHVFPQVAPFIVAQMIFFAPGAILAEASLSFLGLGDPSIPTWGQMLEAGFRTGALYVGYWWWVIPPGLLIIFTAVVFMLLALAIEPVVDPRLRQTR